MGRAACAVCCNICFTFPTPLGILFVRKSVLESDENGAIRNMKYLGTKVEIIVVFF